MTGPGITVTLRTPYTQEVHTALSSHASKLGLRLYEIGITVPECGGTKRFYQ